MLLNTLLTRYQQRLYAGVRRVARRHGINVVTLAGGYFTQKEKQFDGSFLFDLAQRPSLQGALVVSNCLGLELGSEFVAAFFRQRDIPLVSIGKLEGFPYVEVDNRTGFRQVIDHLIRDHGRRRIAFVNGNAANPDAIERKAVYCEALVAHGLSVCDKLMLPGDFLEPSGVIAVRRLFGERGLKLEDVDAIVAANDLMASGVARELAARGVKVPRDIAIVGFDDDAVARSNNPPLTTVAQPVEAVGEQAMDLLIQVLAGRPMRKIDLVRTVPVFRGSCGCSMHFRGAESGRSIDPGGFDGAIRSARANCIERIEQFAGGTVDHRTVDRLFEVLISDDDPTYDTARDAVEEGVLATTALGMDPLRWHDVLTPLSDALKRSGSLEAARRSVYRERLVEVSSLITEVSARTQSAERQRTTEFTSGLHTLGGALTSGRGLRVIGALLRAALPGFGVAFHAVCLFTDASRTKVRVMAWHDDLSQQGGVIIHHSDELWRAAERLQHEPFLADIDGRVFPCGDLLPMRDALGSGQREIVVHPLVFAEDVLGYVVFDTLDNVDRLWLLESLAGSLSGAIHAVLQADQLDHARQVAERASAAKSEFVAVMSHEIRTPLNAILGYLDLCMRTSLTTEQRRYLEQANVSALGLSAIVNDILDLSRIDTHKLELETIRFVLDDVLDALLIELGPSASRKGVEIIVHVAEGVPDVLTGDPVRLRQVLTNLIGNALKFSDHGEVVLTVTGADVVRGDALVLRFAVKDDEIGMSPQQLENLFQPFTQGDSSATRRYGGTGLGLAISKRLVEMMHGEIGVESERGVGSTFTFTAQFQGEGEVLTKSREGVGGLLLVVDDSRAQARALEGLLTGHGFLVTLAHSAQQATQILQECRDDGLSVRAIVLDHTLGDLDGLQFAKRISGPTGVPPAPIVLLGSANARSLFEYDLRPYGIVSVLAKPVPRSLLLQVVRATATSLSEWESVQAGLAQDAGASGAKGAAANTPRSRGGQLLIPRGLLDQLRQMVECYDTAAIDAIDSIRSVAGEPALLDAVCKLEASVRAYDFEQAKRDLDVLGKLIE